MDAYRRALVDALAAGGRVLRRDFGKARISYKGRANLVTQVDHASEEAVLRTLLKRFPSHGTLTEERAPRASSSGFLWVVDPLDGTTNFAHSFPMACVSIGLLRAGEPILGGIYDPFRDELFLAERGLGAWLNGRRIRVSSPPRLSKALVLTGFPYDRLRRSRFYVEFYRSFLVRCHDVRRCGSAALDLAWVAAGRADGFWEFNLNPWDVAAGVLLVEEAGGQVSDYSGRAWSYPHRFGRQTLATNGRIHGAMLRVIRSSPAWSFKEARPRGG